jgi:hypothetical protein
VSLWLSIVFSLPFSALWSSAIVASFRVYAPSGEFDGEDVVARVDGEEAAASNRLEMGVPFNAGEAAVLFGDGRSPHGRAGVFDSKIFFSSSSSLCPIAARRRRGGGRRRECESRARSDYPRLLFAKSDARRPVPEIAAQPFDRPL